MPTAVVEAERGSGRLSVVVRLKTPSSDKPADAAAIESSQIGLLTAMSGSGFTVKHKFRHIPYVVLEVNPAAAAKLASLKEVAGVSPELICYPMLSTSPNTAGAPWSFRQAHRAQGIAVAIIDGGCVQHSFLGGRIVQEFCFSSPTTDGQTSVCAQGAWLDTASGSSCPDPSEHCDHGTHVAGIAAGGNESMTGMARGADIIAMNATTQTHPLFGESKRVFATGNYIAAMEQVLDMTTFRTIAAVNLSFGTAWTWVGTCDTESENHRAVKAIVDLLRDRGVATIVASGNSGDPEGMSFPACLSSVFSVGAVTKSKSVIDFSNSSAELDFLAPGVDILSSIHDGFKKEDGTSMAAPHVTGAWAVLRSIAPDASVNQIADALRQSGQVIEDQRQDRRTPLIQLEDAARMLSRPAINIYPAAGRHQTPLDVQVHVHPTGRDFRLWARTDGQEPQENAGGSVLLDDPLGYNTIRLDAAGEVSFRAKAFYSLDNGTRISTPTAAVEYQLDDPPPGPRNVQATDGTLPERVAVTWLPVSNASGYEVFASTSNSQPERFAFKITPTPIAGTRFEHQGLGGTGLSLYYYVRGIVNGLPTRFGGPDLGSPAVAAIPVQASDGTAPGGIRLTWDPTPWREPGLNVRYEVYRSNDSNVANAQLVTRVEGTFINNFPAGIVVTPAPREYLDQVPQANHVYFYWIKGHDAGFESRLGAGEPGRWSGS